jgi:long-chain fatty acid transport protein
VKSFVKLSTLLFILISTNATATNGYFQHGYGVKSQGMGGVGIALPQDALAAATNPAGMAFIGNRYDLGVNIFRPERESEINGNLNPANNKTHDANETEFFLIPEFGYNKVLNEKYTAGLSIYANGGMNTDYDDGVGSFFGASAGVDLKQIFFTPSFTWKPDTNQSIGVAINFAYQSFQAKGLSNFAGFSNESSNLTDNHHEHSYGLGIKVGWMGKVTDKLTLGATYHSKTYMSKLDDYAGLFAENGDFDIPASYGVGLAYQATPDFTVAFDFQRIEYSDVKSVGNPLKPNLFSSGLGTSDGAGFGWRDVDVFKVGFNYQWDDKLILRAGYNHNSQPIPSSETLFNILAPGVITDHLSIGFTYKVTDNRELTLAYTHAFKQEVKGSNSIPTNPINYGGGEADLEMYQNSLGIAYGVNF